jgi:aminoglycoside phosphotransferase (APT) family kinase protein
VTEQILIKLMNAKYGNFTPVRLSGGYTNETFLLDGTFPPLVAKVASLMNEDIHNEISCLHRMRGTGLVPKVYDFIQSNDVQITVMEYREGINGQSLIDNHDIEKTRELYKSLGKSLATSIHSIPYKNASKEIRTCDLSVLNFELGFVTEALIHHSKDILKKINDTPEEWVLTHGDYGMHNVLLSESNSLTVLDWEWSEWANPLTDIGWVCWFTKLHYPEQAALLNSLFVEDINSILLSSYLLKS